MNSRLRQRLAMTTLTLAAALPLCAGAEPDEHAGHLRLTSTTVMAGKTLPASTINAESLDHALLKAAQDGHILNSASLTGLYSTTPAN